MRLGPGTFEKLVDGIGTVLYTKTQYFSDGTSMTDAKCDGYDFIKVDFEYFQRVAPGNPIGNQPSFSDDTFDI